MTRRRLTDFSLRAIRPRATYFELTDASGLRLGVQPTGSRSWLTRYRRPDNGKPAKLTHDASSLAAARVAHAEALRQLADGIDPGADKQRARAETKQAEADRRADTLGKHSQAFLDFQSRRVRPASWEQQRHVLCDIALAAWDPSRAVSDIRRRDVIELLEEVAVDRPVMANRAAAVLHRFFAWLVERDVIAVNPCAGIKRPTKEQSRERALAPGEIKSLHDALVAIGGPISGAALLMLYTGQRRSECAGLSRGELEDDIWVLPGARTKNKRPHAVPLSRQMRELIAQQPVKSGGDFVFSYDGSHPIGGFDRLKNEVDAVMQPQTPWTWHDLRRTAATGMAGLKVPPHVIEACLNHISGAKAGVAGVYNVFAYDQEKADALQLWARHIDRIVKGETGKVVQLRG
jgi:integrase